MITSTASFATRGTPGRARWAAAAVFFVNGTLMTTFFVRIPTLKADHGLAESQLGLILALFTATALVSMQVAGELTARYGSAWVVRTAAVLMPVSMLSIALADTVVHLALALAVVGVVDGLLDVSMNAHAVAVERALGRPIMNSCQAAWSIGALTGAAIGWLALRLEWSMVEHYMLALGVLALVAAGAGAWTLPALADRVSARIGERRRRVGLRTGWTARVVLLGAIGAPVLLHETAVSSWSGVFLHETLGASLSVASMGLVGFMVLQVAGRLVGDRLHQQFGAPALVRWGSITAILGTALAIFGPSPAFSIVGFAFAGAGGSVVLPVIFSAVGHSGASDPGTANAAAALSRFTTITYSGILLGPVMIGWLAEWIGLTWTFTVLTVLLLGVTLNAAATASADQNTGPRRPNDFLDSSGRCPSQ